MPLAGSNLYKNDIRYQGVIIGNKRLDIDINPDSSKRSFKMMLKNGAQPAIDIEFNSSLLLLLLSSLFNFNPEFSTLMYLIPAAPALPALVHWLFLTRNIRDEPFEVSCPFLPFLLLYTVHSC